MGYFTLERDLGGIAVLRKGRQIEHYSGSLLSDDGTKPSQHMLRELRETCERLEDMGVVCTTNTVVWHSSWFDDCPKDSPILPLLRLTPGLYQHGFTREDAENAKERSCPVYPLVEPDGSCIIIVQGIPLLIRDGAVSVAGVSPEEYGGWYHPLAAKSYHLARCGQPHHNGPCYASYQGVKEWFDRFGIDEAVVEECLTIVKQELSR